MTAGGAAPVLEMRGVSKAFPGVVALDDVDLTLHAGDVHMLLGENGAGKSTLMKILSGAYRKDAGEIRIDGQAVEIGSPRDALALGIRVIYQELNLVPQLSVAENIFLGAMPTRWAGVVDWRALSTRRRTCSPISAWMHRRSTRERPCHAWGWRSVRWSRSRRRWPLRSQARRTLRRAGIEGARDGRADLVADEPRGRRSCLP